MTQEHSAAALKALVAPTLLRAGITLAFAAATIFVTAPSHTVGTWLLALWFVGLGVSILWTERRSAEHSSLSLGGLEASQRSTGYLALLAAAAVVVLGGSLTSLILVVSVGLVLVGLPELWIGLTRRKTHPLGRDWLLTGLLAVGSAIGVLLVSHLDVHAVLGITGGAAIVSGVFLLLAGLTLRHDASRAPNTAVAPEDSRP
ncbi:hypothetical protein [Kocuria sp.]|uniref:hypothetical protein n=1 Tax=Kocuria sp. TaxID=1871328 RepID=UPI0026DF0C49|nr:hypothetical protein [Kocuria sp.]MDO5619194.1 hypothetical protein [Kocuria sp.]